MHAAKVKVTLWRHICNVGRYPLFLAQLPNLSRGFRFVDGRQHHGDGWIVKIGRLELLVVVFDLFLFYTVGDLVVEAVTRADNGDFGVGIEKVQDATCCDLGCVSGQPTACRIAFGERGKGKLTSPPPMIRTFLLRTCQAKMSEPPPWTSGYFSAPMLCQ